jgi:hypothetical protein
MSKPFYKSKVTGNYGILEGLMLSSHSSSHQLKILIAVGGTVDLSNQQENVTTENLVQVSQDEVENALLGF